MGTYASLPDWISDSSETEEKSENASRLGDSLSGRLSDVAIDSVEAVRDERERE